MAPPQRPAAAPGNSAKPRDAGVLVLLYPVRDTVCFVLTKRTDHLNKHKGQVSFPGGGYEDTDENVTVTALREAREELGIALDEVEILGALTELWVPPSNFIIHPTVAFAPVQPVFQANPNEVAALIEAPVRVLLDPTNVGVERRALVSQNGAEQPVPYYLLGGHKVWGATAMVLAEFAALLG